MKAIWKDILLAESNDTIVVEGNHYFPADSLNKEFFKETNTHTNCPWKGIASYYDIKIDGEINSDSAWYYPETKYSAKEIEGRVAFWKGVDVVK